MSSAELTTAGSPACATMSRARRTPPSGATFTTIRSAAPARATLRGSSSLRTLSSAAISTGTPGGPQPPAHLGEARDVRHGLFGVFQPDGGQPGQCLDGRPARPSRRSRPPGSRRPAAPRGPRRPGRRRRRGVWPRSATLILTASTRPNRARISGTRSAATAGTVALTGMLVRSGAGKPCQPASMAAASQREASASPYSGKGQNSPQPSGPAEQQGFALQDARGTSPASAGSPRGRRPAVPRGAGTGEAWIHCTGAPASNQKVIPREPVPVRARRRPELGAPDSEARDHRGPPSGS